MLRNLGNVPRHADHAQGWANEVRNGLMNLKMAK